MLDQIPRRHGLVALRTVAAAAVGACLVGAAVAWILVPLNGNVRYEAGVKVVGTASAAATFSHRPLGFRMVMDVIFLGSRGLSHGIVGFEIAVRLLLALAVCAAAGVLWLGLRRRGVRAAGGYAVVVAGAMLSPAAVSVGEPDWMAMVFAVAAVGVAVLGDRRPWLWATPAGLLLVAAAAMKVVSLPIALLALLAIAVLDRRQARRCLLTALSIGVLYAVVIAVWVPWEIQWLLDIRTVQNSAAAALPEAPAFLLQLTLLWPVLALVPAALVLAGRSERAVSVLALAVGVALVVWQGQYFNYHAVPLIVVAALVVFRGLLGRFTPALGAATFLVAATATVLTTVTRGWLVEHERLCGAGLLVVCVTAVGWAIAVRPRARERQPSGVLAATVVILALLYPGASPWASRLLPVDGPDGTRQASALQSRQSHERTAARVHAVIGGADVPVTYLNFGEWTYFLGNPTSCAYPSPLFLQRTLKPARLGTTSYRENLDCLSAPDARWLIWDSTWFRMRPQPPEVKAIVAREWDCDHARRVAELRLCPRRS